MEKTLSFFIEDVVSVTPFITFRGRKKVKRELKYLNFKTLQMMGKPD